MLRFHVLGPLELHTAHGVFVPRGPKIRQILALLALRPNQVVEVDTLAEELWDGRPPNTDLTTIRTHVYHLRKMLERESNVPSSAELLVTQPAGYLLRLEPEQLDSAVFTVEVDRARRLLDAGQADAASGVLRTALERWRGPALANVGVGRVLSRHLAHLRELKMHALELRIEADMLLGRHRQLIPELRALIAENPLNEWFHAQLIDALRRCGRRGEALTAFHALRTLLDDELGLAPSLELQRLQHEILTSGTGKPGRPHIAALPSNQRAVS
jgi:DNA-binding SARP family transcriptional activator